MNGVKVQAANASRVAENSKSTRHGTAGQRPAPVHARSSVRPEQLRNCPVLGQVRSGQSDLNFILFSFLLFPTSSLVTNPHFWSSNERADSIPVSLPVPLAEHPHPMIQSVTLTHPQEKSTRRNGFPGISWRQLAINTVPLLLLASTSSRSPSETLRLGGQEGP